MKTRFNIFQVECERALYLPDYEYAMISTRTKAGKALRRLAPEGFENLSELVQSIPYHTGLADDDLEWIEATQECNSCQSESPEEYTGVWSTVITRNQEIKYKGGRFLVLDEKCGVVDLAIMCDPKEGGPVVARALINRVRKTYAPIYGDKHFLLQARLEFFGYQEGTVAREKDVRTALETYQMDSFLFRTMDAPRQSNFSVKTITLTNPEQRWVEASATKARWYADAPTEYDYDWMEKTSAVRKQINEEYESAKQAMGKWRKHCKLAGAPINQHTVERDVRINKRIHNTKVGGDHGDYVSSNIYLDSDNKFIHTDMYYPSRWI
jgi:hypothetical protein